MEIFLLDEIEHPFALRIQIFPHIELLFGIGVIFDLVLGLLFLSNLVHFVLLEAEDVVEISLVDIDGFVLFLRLDSLKKFYIDLHAFLDAVVRDGPPTHDSIVDFPDFNAHDEVFGTLPHPFLQVLQQLGSILAEVDVNPLCFGLQYTIFIYKYEPHLSR